MKKNVYCYVKSVMLETKATLKIMRKLFAKRIATFVCLIGLCATPLRRVKQRKNFLGHPISVHGQDPICGSAFFRNQMIIGEIVYRSGWDDTKQSSCQLACSKKKKNIQQPHYTNPLFALIYFANHTLSIVSINTIAKSTVY